MLNFTAKDFFNFFLNPKGKISREHFFIGSLLIFGFSLVSIVLLPILILVIYSYFILCIKRLSDLNKSGFISILNFIPLVNVGLFIYLVLKKI